MNMRKWQISSLTVALVLATAGAVTAFALASGGSGNDDEDVADEWELVEASDWTGGVSLRLPPGWQLNELQGWDSYVGEIVGGGARLGFDFGWYSRPLEVWPESHWPGFALREADVFKTYMAWWCM